MPITPENRLQGENAPPYIPLSLEMDGDMLHIVRDEPGFPINQDWIDRLNKLIDVTPLKPEERSRTKLYRINDGSARSNANDPFSIAIHNENALWKEFGWSEPQHYLNRAYRLSPRRSSTYRMIDPRNSIEMLRFTYDHTGERMLDVLDAYFDILFLPVEGLRRLENALKDQKGCLESLLLQKPHMVTEPINILRSAFERMLAKRKAANAPSEQSTSSESGSCSTSEDIDSILSQQKEALAAKPSEVQKGIRDLAQFVLGGVDMLVIGVPEIINCDQSVIDSIIERASDQDGALPAHRVRMWLRL